MAGHNHDHGHDHGPRGHTHGHHHGAPAAGFDRAFALASLLNGGFVVAEIVFGLAANSVALLADAAHNFGDVLGLLLAWAAARLTLLPPTARRTYGWGRSSILAALANAVVLLVSVGAIVVEALQRLFAPQPVAEGTVVWVAAIGIAINGFTAWLFMRGRERDLNIRAAFLHLAGDAAVSLGVVLAGLLIGVTGWMWLDPVTSIGIAAVILVSTWGVLRDSTDLAMDAVPGGIPRDKVEQYLVDVPGVAEVHDLHIWGLSTTETALTAHLVTETDTADAQLRLDEIALEIARRFGIGHCTIQVESLAHAEACRLRPQHVV